MAMAMTMSERMELRRAALAGARRAGAGAHAGECATQALTRLDAHLDAVPPGRRLAWVARAANEVARSGHWSIFDAERPAGRRVDDASWLDHALQGLDEHHRQVLALTYGEGLTAVEIGRLIGCPVETVTRMRQEGRLTVGACTA